MGADSHAIEIADVHSAYGRKQVLRGCTLRVLKAADGSQHDWDRVAGAGWKSELVLSTRFVLRRMYTKVPRGQKATLLPWVLVSLKNGEQQPTVNPPEVEHLVHALPGRARARPGRRCEGHTHALRLGSARG